MFLCQYYIVFITIALWYDLKSWITMSPAGFFIIIISFCFVLFFIIVVRDCFGYPGSIAVLGET